MSFSAPIHLARSLDRIDIDNRKRPAGADRADLVAKAQQALSDAELLGVPDLLAAAGLRIAEVHMADGAVRPALGALDIAMGALGALREEDLKVRVLALMAECHATARRWGDVERVCAEGIEIVERYRYRVSSAYLRSAYLRSRISLYSLGVRAAVERGDHGTMLERAELSKCRGLVSGGGDRMATPSPLDEGQIAAAFAKANARVERGRTRGDVPASLLAERRMLWDLLTIATRRSAGGGFDEMFDLGKIQARLAIGQSAVYHYWIDRSSLLIVTMDRDDLTVETRTFDPERRAALDDLAAAILGIQPGHAVTLVDQTQDFAESLWPSTPEASRIVGRARRLVLSPHQSLHAIPFHALKIDGDFVIRRHAVRYAPNLTCLALDGPRQSAEPALLALGIGDYRVPGEALIPLPHAEEEVEALDAIYREGEWKVDVLKGADANESALGALSDSNELQRFSRLHLACHGQNVNADTPMESALYLADSRLEGVEIPLLRLGADMVVLSACCSGQRSVGGRGMDQLPGDEMLGLQAAFFAAGTSEIVASLWPVDSVAAKSVSLGLHRYSLDGLPTDMALQKAICDYLDSANALTRTRFFWAPFQLTSVGPSPPAPV